MKFINKMRKKTNGFTLVEIIVVLVILAILAAFTIPAMLGFVTDANKKANLAEARTAYIAAQSTATEMLANGKTVTEAATAITGRTGKMLTLIGASGAGKDVPGAITAVTVDATGKVTALTYTSTTTPANVYKYTNGVLSIS